LATSHRAIPQCAFSHYAATFANDLYEVKRFPKEDGKERVYLAQDALLDKRVDSTKEDPVFKRPVRIS